MTREQFDQKFAVLVDQVPEILRSRADFLLKTGAVDLEGEEDTYLLPKAVLTACLRETAEQFNPYND